MADQLLKVTDLGKSYDRPRWISASVPVSRPALVDVSFSLDRGETLGIVGESGSGKSTLAKCLVLLERPDRGGIKIDGAEITVLKGAPLRSARRRIQIIFQDPYSSLNPHLTVGDALAEVLLVHKLVPRPSAARRVRELLDLVGLPASAMERFPNSFSGGQRQRICLARALAAEPDILVADEPVSSLDVSIQAQILNLLLDLRDRLGLAMLFISHNLFVVQYVAPRVAIMFGGRIVESLDPGSPLTSARHPYTQALLAAAPTIEAEPAGPNLELLNANLFSALPIAGCPYRERCPHAFEPCLDIDPPELPFRVKDHLVACHYVAGNRDGGAIRALSAEE